MITNDLIEYIKSQLSANVSNDLIIANLVSVGWKLEDINEGFEKIKSLIREQQQREVELLKNESIPVVNSAELEKEIKEKFDPYREAPDGIDVDQLDPYKVPEIKIEKEAPQINNEIKTINKVEEVNKEEVKEPEPLKVWVPSSIKPKEIEIANLELTGNVIKVNPDTPSPVLESQTKPIENIVTTEKAEELIPIISKGRSIDPVEQKVNTIADIGNDILSGNESVADNNELKNNIDVVRSVTTNSAIISSYKQDILAANKEPEAPVRNNKSKFIKLAILIGSILILGGMAFAFVEGYIKIPWLNLNISFVKKDPKTFLLGAPRTLSQLKSYKVDTNINISIPSLSNITTGLASGEVVHSNDRDSISIITKGLANHTSSGINFDYQVNVKSSIIKNDITGNVKYDGENMIATIPDLKQLLGANAPDRSVVKFTPDEVGELVSQFSPQVQDMLKKINSDLLSGNISSQMKDGTSLAFVGFINSLNYVDKGKEEIHGIETYHYELTADRQSTKNLLLALSGIYMTSLSDEEKENIEEMLSSSNITSIDVWVGSDDNNLYQIKFVISTPLSRVLKLNDSGLADDALQIEWKTTYYDIDVPNDINFSAPSISMESFINNIRNKKIESIISYFKADANFLKNAIGSYGTRTNPTGSCTNPNPGSLFSPQGHKNTADVAVGIISDSLKKLLSATNGLGYCYSSPTAWAIAAPISYESQSEPQFYCMDNLGNFDILSTPIKGTNCK